MHSPSGSLTWHNSPCEVLLGLFPFRSLPADADGVQRFLVSNFPHAAEVTFRTRGGQLPRRLQVSGDVLEIPYSSDPQKPLR